MTVQDSLVLLAGVKDILLGTAGGVIAYLLDYTRAKRSGDIEFVFRFSSMIINALLGAFVAYIVGSVLDSDVTYRDAMIGLSGVTAYNILLLVESRFAKFIVDKITGTK